MGDQPATRDWSRLDNNAVQCLFSYLEPADVAAMRATCRAWAKGLAQHAKQWRLMAPVHLFEWEYVRGTLYCLAPVLSELTLTVSNRVETETLAALCRNLDWWTRLQRVRVVSLRPQRSTFGSGLALKGSLEQLRHVKSLQALEFDSVPWEAALNAVSHCRGITHLAMRMRSSPLAQPARLPNAALKQLEELCSPRPLGSEPPPNQAPPDQQRAGMVQVGNQFYCLDDDSDDEEMGGPQGRPTGPRDEAGSAAGCGGGGGAVAAVRSRSRSSEGSDTGSSNAAAAARAACRQRASAVAAASKTAARGGGGDGAAGVCARPHSGRLQLRHLEFDVGSGAGATLERAWQEHHHPAAANGHHAVAPAAGALNPFQAAPPPAPPAPAPAGLMNTVTLDRVASLLDQLPCLEHLAMHNVTLSASLVSGPLARMLGLTELHASVQDGGSMPRAPHRALQALAALAAMGQQQSAPAWPPQLPAAPVFAAGAGFADPAARLVPGPGRPALHLTVSQIHDDPSMVLDGLVPLTQQLQELSLDLKGMRPGNMYSIGSLTALESLSLTLPPCFVRALAEAEREAAPGPSCGHAGGSPASGTFRALMRRQPSGGPDMGPPGMGMGMGRVRPSRYMRGLCGFGGGDDGGGGPAPGGPGLPLPALGLAPLAGLSRLRTLRLRGPGRNAALLEREHHHHAMQQMQHQQQHVEAMHAAMLHHHHHHHHQGMMAGLAEAAGEAGGDAQGAGMPPGGPPDMMMLDPGIADLLAEEEFHAHAHAMMLQEGIAHGAVDTDTDTDGEDNLLLMGDDDFGFPGAPGEDPPLLPAAPDLGQGQGGPPGPAAGNHPPPPQQQQQPQMGAGAPGMGPEGGAGRGGGWGGRGGGLAGMAAWFGVGYGRGGGHGRGGRGGLGRGWMLGGRGFWAGGLFGRGRGGMPGPPAAGHGPELAQPAGAGPGPGAGPAGAPGGAPGAGAPAAGAHHSHVALAQAQAAQQARMRAAQRNSQVSLSPADISILTRCYPRLEVLALRGFRLPGSIVQELSAGLPLLRHLSVAWHEAEDTPLLLACLLPPMLHTLELEGTMAVTSMPEPVPSTRPARADNLGPLAAPTLAPSCGDGAAAASGRRAPGGRDATGAASAAPAHGAPGGGTSSGQLPLPPGRSPKRSWDDVIGSEAADCDMGGPAVSSAVGASSAPGGGERPGERTSAPSRPAAAAAAGPSLLDALHVLPFSAAAAGLSGVPPPALSTPLPQAAAALEAMQIDTSRPGVMHAPTLQQPGGASGLGAPGLASHPLLDGAADVPMDVEVVEEVAGAARCTAGSAASAAGGRPGIQWPSLRYLNLASLSLAGGVLPQLLARSTGLETLRLHLVRDIALEDLVALADLKRLRIMSFDDVHHSASPAVLRRMGALRHLAGLEELRELRWHTSHPAGPRPQAASRQASQAAAAAAAGASAEAVVAALGAAALAAAAAAAAAAGAGAASEATAAAVVSPEEPQRAELQRSASSADQAQLELELAAAVMTLTELRRLCCVSVPSWLNTRVPQLEGELRHLPHVELDPI